MSTPGGRPDVDLIILGGGCAGLSLAQHLSDSGSSLRVAIVEPRLGYHEDRTWCGWRLTPHAFADCAVATWHEWKIATPAGEIVRGSEQYPYEMVRSDLFYEKASRAIDRHPSMDLLRGLSADQLYEAAGHVEVALSDGSRLSAPWVIDTRPAPPTVVRPWLWQNFVGFVINVEASIADRIGQLPMLMDFQPPGTCVAQFMYLLPMGDCGFLCEWTQFAANAGQYEEIEHKLRDWLDGHAGSGWTIERTEQGSLPMALAPLSPTGRIVRAGAQGGSMRASTGYAFHAIQRWAAACAASLLETGTPLPPQRSRLLEKMDAIFLEVLQDPSVSAMEIFRRLFANSPPESLVRFLAGTPRHSDLWPVMRGLPWAKFLRAAPILLRSRSRALRPLPVHSAKDAPSPLRSGT